MVVTLLGEHTVIVQSHVEVEHKLDSERVPIHHQKTVVKTVADWVRVHLAENATIRTVQVRLHFPTFYYSFFTATYLHK